MLIQRAEIAPGEIVDVRIAGGRIAELAPRLTHHVNEELIDAAGHALLPGLHDHHIHLRALAASLASVRCGPPQVEDLDHLAAALRAADARLGPGDWLRGIAYHESVAGELDRAALDALLPDRPLRIQHRSGRLWMLNSAALDALAPDADAPLESRDGRWTGRLYDADDWLRARLRGTPPSLYAASRWLASRGVTGVTDTTHHNGAIELHTFAQGRRNGQLLQHIRLMGNAQLDACANLPGTQRGEHKFHLHEHDLPDIDGLVAAIRASHAVGRCVAFHCVTRTDLVFALAALREAGPLKGDRIEHAAIAPPELVDEIAALNLIVVTQPNFIAERGDDYLRDVDAADQPWLYRLRGFVDAGVPLAGSTDAPFGEPDPWAAMQAAVSRRTPAGIVLGGAEALDPHAALALFLAPLEAPGGAPRRVVAGAMADLCLLDRASDSLHVDPSAARVRATFISGKLCFSA
ncbi:amidohydrolase family protein [Fontimonas sp. SYSU GA230001]|uniref:amidohydrolase family protein n=1 Tax=Fontimonas sp. SYSU GA230001 TaxID=3142450 RepID=UPI0032B5C864